MAKAFFLKKGENSMRKQSNSVMESKAKEVVSAVIYAFYVIGSIYGPALDKLTKQYVELNKDKKSKKENNLNFDEEAYKKTKTEIIKEAERIVSPAKEKIENTIQIYGTPQKPECNIINNWVADILEGKIREFLLKFEKMEIVPYQDLEQYLLNTIALGEELIAKELETNRIKTLNQIKEFNRKAEFETSIWNNPVFEKFGLISSSVTFAIQIFLSMGGTEAIKNIEERTTTYESVIIEEIEEFLEDKLNTAENYFREIKKSIFREETAEVSYENIYREEFSKILDQEGMSLETKLNKIIHSGLTSYQNIFDYCLEEPRIYTKLSINQTINEIMHSGITSPNNLFDYVLGMKTINRDTKMNCIINSGIASNQEIFHYVLTECGLKKYEAMEYITRSKIATYEEKLAFITKNPDFSIEQKVVYSLLIPDVSSEKIMDDLLKLEGTAEEQTVKAIINADMVPFKVIFNTLSKQETISQEKLLEYVTEYNANFNVATIQEKAAYLLTLSDYDDNVKLDAIWNMLSEYTPGQKFDFIFELFETDFEEYLNTYYMKRKNVTEKQQRMKYLVNKVLDEMQEKIVNNRIVNSMEELVEVFAVVGGEGDFRFEDYYWVGNVVYNRTTNPVYVRKHGTNPYNQVSIKSQFAAYKDKIYYTLVQQRRLDTRYELAELATTLMFYLGDEGICQSFLEFRWSGTDLYNIKIVPGGNRYGRPMSESSRVENENPIEDEIYTLERILSKMKFS